MENPNMPIAKCDLTNLCLQYTHKVHQYSFSQIHCHYHLWTKLVARFSIIDRQHQQIYMLLFIFIRCLILNCYYCYSDANGFDIYYYMLLIYNCSLVVVKRIENIYKEKVSIWKNLTARTKRQQELLSMTKQHQTM